MLLAAVASAASTAVADVRSPLQPEAHLALERDAAAKARPTLPHEMSGYCALFPTLDALTPAPCPRVTAGCALTRTQM